MNTIHILMLLLFSYKVFNTKSFSAILLYRGFFVAYMLMSGNNKELKEY
jgi:hypothetical protein